LGYSAEGSKKVVRLKVAGRFAEALNYFRVRDTVEHHLIQLITEGFGQAGDKAIAPLSEAWFRSRSGRGEFIPFICSHGFDVGFDFRRGD
jgi:hypothetical protein